MVFPIGDEQRKSPEFVAFRGIGNKRFCHELIQPCQSSTVIGFIIDDRDVHDVLLFYGAYFVVFGMCADPVDFKSSKSIDGYNNETEFIPPYVENDFVIGANRCR